MPGVAATPQKYGLYRMSSPSVIWNSYSRHTSGSASVTNAGHTTLARSPLGSSAGSKSAKRPEKSSSPFAELVEDPADEQALAPLQLRLR